MVKDLLIRNNLIPLHYQIQKYILSKIKSKEWKANEFIPTERELIELFKVSRITIRNALGTLENGGYVKKMSGKGTIVSLEKQKILIGHIYGLYSYFKAQGFNVKTKIFSSTIEKPNKLIREILKLKKNEEIIRIERLRIIDEEPLYFSILNISKKYCPALLDEDLKNKSLYSIIENDFGLEINRTKTVFYSLVSDSNLQYKLNIREAEPMQVLESTAYIKKTVPIEYSINYFRTNKILFELDFSKNGVIVGVKRKIKKENHL